MAEVSSRVTVGVGFASETGLRPRNEDFTAAVLGSDLDRQRDGAIAAIADGMGGARGGRVAAEMAVRGFIDGFWDMPETIGVQRAAARVIDSLNGWLFAQGRRDAELAGMGCAFTAIVMRDRKAHMLHIGDTRAYRLTGERLARLTTDHVDEGPGRGHLLTRALGVEATVRLDYAVISVTPHDRFLLCTDGVHGKVPDEQLAEILAKRSAPADAAREVVAAALEAGSADNCTALVMDVVSMPVAAQADVGSSFSPLPLIPVPHTGESVDGFLLKTLLSDGRYTCLFVASDEIEGGTVVVKFPKPAVASEATYKAAFTREAWVGMRINSPWVVKVVELQPGRQTCLYTVMPLYEGETLEQRIGHPPQLGLEEGRHIAINLARAIGALHRAKIIHRDVNPSNVVLLGGGALKLIDLGVVRTPELEDNPPKDVPGTLSYMAPEMFDGEVGNEATDIYALGVTMYRAYTGEFPYGEVESTTRLHFSRHPDMLAPRPDLPAWVDAAIRRAIAVNPRDRYRDVMEFMQEFEAGPSRAVLAKPRARTLYERNPIRFWQVISALLAIGLALSLLRH